MEKILKTLKDTEDVANELAKKLVSPVIIAFTGDLGAGKTTFIKYLCKALGYDGAVTSPTFAIMNQYDGVMPIYHYDMYRISGADALDEIGFYDFADSGISLVEWSENVADAFEGDEIVVRIEKLSDTGRKISIGEETL